MLTTVMIVILIAIVLKTYIAFFVFGGAFSLFRTTLNAELSPRDKLKWMLVQVYSPPTTLLYLATVEKNMKWKIAGIVLTLAVGAYAIHSTASMNWNEIRDAAPMIAQKISKRLQEKKEEKASKVDADRLLHSLSTRLNPSQAPSSSAAGERKAELYQKLAREYALARHR
ncbi:MAG: hypothetical protein P4M13_09950 [Alphaproteobacteria bacterium]|nr:hypothetical protein [Alphaproteobacteria bacterium]